MNFIFITLSLLFSFHGVFVICQLEERFEMLELIQKYNEISNSSETKKCLPLIRGEYKPDVFYVLGSCTLAVIRLQAFIIFFRSVINTAECGGLQCWESVLTDASKFQISDIFNKYRQTVARGTCGSRCANNKQRLIFTMRWDQNFEFEAWHWIKTYCAGGKPPMFKVKAEKITLLNFGEFISVTFQVVNGSQRELRDKLEKLLDDNYLFSWNDTTKQFRRGLANMFGCAFIVRHGVTMKTDLKENVQNGKVAHFGCFFASNFASNINLDFAKTPDGINTTATTTENCKRITKAVVRTDSLYPSLCVEIGSEAEMSCQPDVKEHGELQHNAVCSGTKSIKNEDTWNEKVYGYVVRWFTREDGSLYVNPQCNLPEFSKPSTPKPEIIYSRDYNCSFKYEVDLVTNEDMCPKWNCDDSQLTIATRQQVLDSLNKARHFVAQEFCSYLCTPPCCTCNNTQYCNMMKLQWHWYLESKAAEAIKYCFSEYNRSKTHYDDSPFGEPVFYEKESLIFELPPGGQINLADKVAELFWRNGFHDWDPDGGFRRGNAAWVGCAIVVRPGIKFSEIRPEYKVKDGIATHLACVFASLGKDFNSQQGSSEKECCPDAVKKQPPFLYLCSSVSKEVEINCGVNKCPSPHQHSPAWKLVVEEQRIKRELGDDSLEYMERNLLFRN